MVELKPQPQKAPTPTAPTTPTKPTTPPTPTPKPTTTITITPEIVQRFFNSARGGRHSEIEDIVKEVAAGPIADQTGAGLRVVDHNVGAVYRVIKKLSLTDKVRVRPLKKGASKPCIIGRIK
jgi:hypothetical protein